MRERLPPIEEPWISRRAWRRLVEAHASGRIGRADLELLKRRLARVRHEPAATATLRPRLRLIPGGDRPGPSDPTPTNPTPRKAA